MKFGRLAPFNFGSFYYKYTKIKTVWSWQKDRTVYAWTEYETQSSKIDPYLQLKLFMKIQRQSSGEKDNLFSKWY